MRASEAFEVAAREFEDLARYCFQNTPPTGDICGEEARESAKLMRKKAQECRAEEGKATK